MAKHDGADEAVIREKAYHLWEKEGRPHGRDNEFWTRASVSVTEAAQLGTLTESAEVGKRKTRAQAKNGAAKTKKK